MMTYKELDAVASTSPAMHSKLVKLLAVVSIRKLHARIEVMSASGALPARSRRPSLVIPSEAFLRSPSFQGRKASDGGLSSVNELRRKQSTDMSGLPYGLSTPRAGSKADHSFSYSMDEGFTQPTTPRPSNMPKSPRIFARQPSTDLSQARRPSLDLSSTGSPQPETLLRRRMATTLQIRDAVIWQDTVAADFRIADGNANPIASAAADGTSPDAINKLLQLHPSVKSLQQMTYAQKLDVWDTYHTNVINGGTANKVMQPAELRELSRDVIELVLRNYVRWLKQSKHGSKLTEAAYRAIVQAEREFLLPGKKGQTDAQAINAMSRHLTMLMTASKTKNSGSQLSTSTSKGSIPTITQELFCMSFDRAMQQCLHIKTKDQGLGCSIQ